MREFFRIMVTAAKEKYLCGAFFAPNMTAVQKLSVYFFSHLNLSIFPVFHIFLLFFTLQPQSTSQLS